MSNVKITRVCALCKKPLASGKNRAKFCDLRCAALHKRSRQAELFWSKVDKNGPVPAHRPELGKCWIWTGSHQRYGRVGFRDEIWLAHRVSYVMAFGEVPDGLCVCHSCDNTLCQNPAHLFIGTHQDNMTDKSIKGRVPEPPSSFVHSEPKRGTRNGSSKLTEADVVEIREMRKRGLTLLAIGELFGVSLSAIHLIVTRKKWRHVA